MIKLILAFLIFLIPSISFSQISVSFGIERVTENKIDFDEHFVRLFNSDNLFTHNSIFVRGDFRFNNMEMNIGFHYFKKKNLSYNESSSYSYGGGSSPVSTETNKYYSKFNMSYIGINVGSSFVFDGNGIIFKKTDASVRIGGFVNFDFINSFDETRKDYLYSYGTSISATTYSDYTDSIDNVMGRANFVPSIGLTLRRRLTYRQIFIEGSISFGFTAYRLISAVVDFGRENNQSFNGSMNRRFIQTNIGIGYTFKKKELKNFNE